MRILVTGSREWTDAAGMFDVLSRMHLRHPDAVLVHGDCAGADKTAAAIWEFLGGPTEAHPAEWSAHGKAAGPLRNQRMVDAGADACLAFPMPGSRGTWDCVRRARLAGIPVEVITPSNPEETQND